jgi:hypothetical protein
MPILFDDCNFAHKEPFWGKQDSIRPGVHNSCWTPSPGPTIAQDPAMEQSLSEYVKDVIGAFKDSKQIVAWDLYNEPLTINSMPLAEKSFAWAREIDPVQPLTIGLHGIEDFEFRNAELSDVISYHDYCPIEKSRQKAELLEKYNRPLICTEWLHRAGGNTFETHLPLFREKSIGFYNWGFVAGKIQTYLSWSTIDGEPDANPEVWQHDLFHPNGQPYSEDEISLLKAFMSM